MTRPEKKSDTHHQNAGVTGEAMTRQLHSWTATALELVGKIYDAAASPVLWPRFLDAFTDATRGDATLIWLHDTANRNATHQQPDPSFPGHARIDCSCGERYAEHSTYANALLEAVHSLPEGSVVTPPPKGITDVIGGPVLKRGSTVTIFSSSRRKRYGDRERRLVGQLMPHLRRACLLHLRLTRLDLERSGALAALDLLPTAVWLLDARGRVVLANRAGHELDAGRDGLWLSEDGSPTTADPRTQQALHEIVAETIAAGAQRSARCAGGLRVPRQRCPASLQVTVYPLPGDALKPGSAAAMFIVDPARAAAPDEKALRSFYGFTRTESQLAAALSRGGSLDDYCRANAVSANTARTHLKSILAKTGTHRQAQLVSLLANMPLTVPAHARC